MGDCFSDGWNGSCAVNYTAAAAWYQAAGRMYSGSALVSLSDMHALGLGVPRNFTKVCCVCSLACLFACISASRHTLMYQLRADAVHYYCSIHEFQMCFAYFISQSDYCCPPVITC